MCDETRTMDLSGLGGVANAQVMGTVVQHVSSVGELLFQWNPFDHFEITDLAPASRTGPSVNWMHGNSLDLDSDGNLIVSFRSLSEITKIDTRTGAVLWRMGGLKNQFTFQDAGAPAFSFQHGVRLTAPAHLLLLDNLGDPAGSRAERYAYDAALHTAQLVASYGPSPGVTAQLGGSAQDLPGGRTLVSFGPAGRVEEYDASGQVVWHIEGNAGYVFRAQRIRSLYRPGVGSPRELQANTGRFYDDHAHHEPCFAGLPCPARRVRGGVASRRAQAAGQPLRQLRVVRPRESRAGRELERPRRERRSVPR